VGHPRRQGQWQHGGHDQQRQPARHLFETSVDLASYAGQTITLSFAENNDAELPTSLYLDDVGVLA
jgi:hypothetical protein